jgi:hypothetical protein
MSDGHFATWCSLIDELRPQRAAVGSSSARFWRLGESPFYIGVLQQRPIPLGEKAHELFPGFPKGASLLAITARGRRWKIYSIQPKQTKWLRTIGLDDAVFSTRREAVWHLKEALKGLIAQTRRPPST